MTPAVELINQLQLEYRLHEYQHDATASSYGLEAADKLGVNPEQVFKTLVISNDKSELAVAVVPISTKLNLKKTAKALGYKKVDMALPKVVERTTGYVMGGVSPLAQKKRLPTIIDKSAIAHQTIYISGGKRGLEIEISPHRLVETLSALVADVVDTTLN